MRYFSKFLMVVGLMIGFYAPEANAQQVDTVFEKGFEVDAGLQVTSQCNYQWNRTTTRQTEGNYSLTFESGQAQRGCVSSVYMRSFNVNSNIQPNDTLFVFVDFYKSNDLATDDDFVQLGLFDDQGDDVARTNYFRNTQKGVQTNSEGFLGIVTTIPGSFILDSTSSNQFSIAMFGVSGGSGADMFIDNIEILHLKSSGQNFVNVDAPNGGEQLEQGQNFNIQWSTSSTVNQVDLAFSDDGGTTWVNIASNLNASQGAYNWTVPNVNTNQGVIRARSSNDPTISGVSQGTFSIVDPQPQISIANPGRFDNLEIASTVNIQWNSANTNEVDLQYSTNNGNNWATIENNVDASSGAYAWVVPNTPASGSGMIRILNADGNSYGDTVEDLSIVSDNAPAITLTEPSENDTFRVNSQVDIEWVANDQVSNVDIEFSNDNGSTWSEVTSGVDASDGSYQWTTPSAPVSNAVVRVKDSDNKSIVDASGAFSIVSEIKTLSLIQPSVGDTLEGNSSYTIRWSASVDVNQVLIEYSDDGGSSWTEIASNVSGSQETYDWTVPSETIENAVARITDEEDNTISAQSGNFYIDGNTGFQSMEEVASLSLYPNPATEKVRIDFPDDKNPEAFDVRVISADGQSIQQNHEYEGGKTISLNVDHLPSGIYYVKINGPNGHYIGKFAKQ